MSQSVLDPRTTYSIGSWRPPESLPLSLRAFGRFPNVDEWLPGDLVLLSALDRGRISQYIVNCQVQGGFAEVDARWHHAQST